MVMDTCVALCKLFATEKVCPSRGCVPWEGQGALPEHQGPVMSSHTAGCHLKLLGTAADQVCVHSGLVRFVPVGLILDPGPEKSWPTV